jgi:hypothetical protein
VERSNFNTIHTDQYDHELNDRLPAELIGALRVLSESYNPNPIAQQFVWALRPFPVKDPPSTYLQAVGEPGSTPAPSFEGVDDNAVHSYLTAVGLVASENSRRSARYNYVPVNTGGMPRWKQVAINTAYRTPRTGAAFQKVYRRLR